VSRSRAEVERGLHPAKPQSLLQSLEDKSLRLVLDCEGYTVFYKQGGNAMKIKHLLMAGLAVAVLT